MIGTTAEADGVMRAGAAVMVVTGVMGLLADGAVVMAVDSAADIAADLARASNFTYTIV